MAQGSRLEKKIDICLENKEYYEAHQVYRTLYHRWLAAEKYDDLLRLLHDGSLKLFEARQIQSALDLADLYANTLNISKQVPSDQTYNSIIQLLLKINDFARAEESEENTGAMDARNKFVSTVVSWSRIHATKNREKKRGLSELHHKMALAFWKKSHDFEAARNHMMLAEAPEELASLLVEIHKQLGHASEIDLFATLAILQLLCLHRVKTASRFLLSYIDTHPDLNCGPQPPYPLPLLNFCSSLINMLPRRNLKQFHVLLEKHHDELNRDPNYAGYLKKISHLFFNIPDQQGGGGLLGNLFKGLLGDDKKDEEVFSDSDMDEDSSMDHDGDDEGFTTASEEEAPPRPPVVAPKKPVIDQMEDLD